MKLNKLASAILRGSWLIDSRSVEILYPVAERFVNGEKVSWFESESQNKKEFLEAFIITEAGYRQNIKASAPGTDPENIYSNAAPGSIAVLPVEGTIMKDDYCGTIGTDTLSSWLTDALLAPNIIGAVLKVNSPGGTVEGTQEFADVIATVNSLMPVEVYCDGQLCSAAYWLASSLNITSSSGTCEFGCIGTAASFTDYSKGSIAVKHYIPADASFDKNKTSIEALKGNYQPIKDSVINPTNDIFLNAVKTGRGDKLKTEDVANDAGDIIGQYPLTGQVYLAQAAIDNGLIDAIGNMESVTASIRQRAQKSTSTKYNMNLFGNKNPGLKALGLLKEKKAADITEAEIVAVNDELTQAGFENVAVITADQLEEAHNNADMLTSGLAAINTALGLDAAKSHTTIAAAITALVADRDAQFDRAETFGEQPGAIPTNPVTKAKTEGNAVQTKELTSYEQKAAQKLAQFETQEK